MADFPAEQLVADDLGHSAGLAGPVLAQELFFPCGAPAPAGAFFQMRGVDSVTLAFTTWVATSPDPNGVQATPLNTTPALVGAIVAASGFIIASW